MDPTMCRIVVYNHPGSADGKYAPAKSPAIVREINDDGTVGLWIFGANGIHHDKNVAQGNGPCQWIGLRAQNNSGSLNQIQALIQRERW